MFKKDKKKTFTAVDFAYKWIVKSQKLLAAILCFATLFGAFAQPVFAIIDSQRKEEEIVEVPSDDVTSETTYLPAEDVPIVSEDIAKRTAYEKHFRKMDGTYEVSIYEEAVHYLKDNKWEDINNSLQVNRRSNQITNKANQFQVSFPEKLTEKSFITMDSDAYRIGWYAENIQHMML